MFHRTQSPSTMSTGGGFSIHENTHKRKGRACDMCRRKKRRCDGGDLCGHCKKLDFPCTYIEPAKIRHVAPSEHCSEDSLPQTYDSDFVKSLELRLETAAASLRQIQHHTLLRLSLSPKIIRSFAKPLAPPHPEDSDFLDVVDSFRTLSLQSDPGFQGKSSAGMLVKAAVEAKIGEERFPPILRDPTPPAPDRPWERHLKAPPHNLSFPDDQLLVALINLYFANVNSFLPVLLRPQFEASLKHGLHKTSGGFGTLVLLVAALGSLHLSDPTLSHLEQQSLAWTWYNQVELCGDSLRRPPTLHNIQAYCLAVQFLHRTSNPRFAWAIVGFGLRLAQDVGFHRHKFNDSTISVDEELEKRAFWTLLYLDTFLSGGLGRSPIHDPIELDLTLPSDCDDEYWGPSGPGEQPTDKPSITAFFICLLNLYRILHFSTRTLYTIYANHVRLDRLEDLPYFGAELDSALDHWFSSIPAHLHLNPEHPDGLFFDQSSALMCVYYYTRIIIHRPFIPGLYSFMPLDPLALGVCTAAARACIRVAANQQRRRPNNPLPLSQSPVFTAALMLILNKSMNPPGLAADLALVSTCIEIFRHQSQFWPSSGFFVLVLERLVATDHPSPAQLDNNPVSWGAEPSAPKTRQVEVGSSSVDPPNLVSAPIPPNPRQPEADFFPVFVGDEDILPRTARRPLVVSHEVWLRTRP
ncbi:fungal-specific transcription factor domain-containing protein [Mycena galopus ATCC 62051]|nr:fungal-specific transcription factor domain-containing protein [Mycena galopus ATCC 62051]